MRTHLFRYPPTRRPTPANHAAALLLLAGVLAGTAGNAAITARSQGPHHMAYDPVTGTMVSVAKPTDNTPVHPEAITHPRQDGMTAVAAGPVSNALRAGVAVEDAVTMAAHPPGLHGIDVSGHQGRIRWAAVAPHIHYAYVKATEGIYYRNPRFKSQYEGAYYAHRIHAAYHFAIPNNSGGAAQAHYFAHHGGGWSDDGRTLPGALDIERNPYGRACYGLTPRQMRRWISNFVHEYAYETGVYPVIYTTNSWWRTCTRNAKGFQKFDPLWIACFCSHAGALPGGYGYYTFWQYADHGSLPGDQDVFNGSPARLEALARG